MSPPDRRRGVIEIHGDLLTIATESSDRHDEPGWTLVSRYRAANGVLTTTPLCWVDVDGRGHEPLLVIPFEYPYSVTPTALVLRSPTSIVRPDESGVVDIYDEAVEDQVFVRSLLMSTGRPKTSREMREPARGGR